jgi:NAD(P)-dependent dehydrogenase (short-subunit alcohol dehydrogenase family)
VQEIADTEGRLDGLIAAAGIQQETSALEYTAEDANRMFEVNITGVFMCAQAVAKQMIRFGKGGSIVMIASMFLISCTFTRTASTDRCLTGSYLPSIQCIEGRCHSTRT